MDAQEPKKQTVAEMDAEIKAVELATKKALLAKVQAEEAAAKIELQAAALKNEERELTVNDLKGRISERKMKEESRGNRFKDHGKALDQAKNSERAQQGRCNHRKGGNELVGYIGGQGTKEQYAILKHQFANNDIWVRCLRCGKTWKPPVKSEHFYKEGIFWPESRGGVFDAARYDAAFQDYRIALSFPTNNAPSGSYTFKFEGEAVVEENGFTRVIPAGEWYREVTKASSLR